MNLLDWLVLVGTLSFIVIYGVWKSRGSRNIKGYLLGDNELKWWTIGLSVMATQASAITFLSTPGQAYVDGMRFVQFYLGLPIAMVILCVTFIPIYYRLKVYTAYEYLESRFDLKTRTLAASLFLIQRGLAAGITIYAPSIILSTIMGWDLQMTNLVIGILVIIYTVSGGTKAVSVTQKQQMIVIMGGMFIAFGFLISYLSKDLSFGQALAVAGKMDKLNTIDFSFNLKDRYNFWSGITGGLFLALAYFGTDQSQVARYLSGRSIRESRLGLIMNGLVKVPMQFFILLVGVMVFLFYQFNQPPVFFNTVEKEAVYATAYAGDMKKLDDQYTVLFQQKKEQILDLNAALEQDQVSEIAFLQSQIKTSQAEIEVVREEVKTLIKQSNPNAELNDKDHVFLSFILNYLPHGLIGLLLTVILCAAMSSTASEINALASTTTVDLYKRSMKKNGSEQHYLNASRWWTVAWGVIAILVANVANLFDNLIQLVNILGSLFYGTILGIFLAAFYFKYIKSNAVFIAALLAELLVLSLFFVPKWFPESLAWLDIGYLWYNVIGCLAVLLFGTILQGIIGTNNKKPAAK